MQITLRDDAAYENPFTINRIFAFPPTSFNTYSQHVLTNQGFYVTYGLDNVFGELGPPADFTAEHPDNPFTCEAWTVIFSF